MPTHAIPDPASPATKPPTPSTVSIAPVTRPRSDRPLWSIATSRMAAIGGTREARREGNTADTMVTPVPTTRATTAVRAANTVPPAGMSIPNALSIALRRPATPTPANNPMTDAKSPIKHGLEQLGPHHLAACRPQRPQQRHLAGSLGDDDLERVVDREAGHDQPDRREHEEERVEEPESLCDGVLSLLGDLGSGQDLGSRRDLGGQACGHLLLADALDCSDHHGVDLAAAAEQHGLGRRQVEDGDARPSGRVDRAEPGRADERELVRTGLREHDDGVADLEAALVGAALVDQQLVRPWRRGCLR